MGIERPFLHAAEISFRIRRCPRHFESEMPIELSHLLKKKIG